MPGRRRRMSADQLPELAARQGVDPGRRLVQDQQIGVVNQRAAQAELLLHAAGKLAGRALGESEQIGRAQQVVDALRALVSGVAEQAAEEIEVVEHRQRGVEIAPQPLRHVGDALAHARAVGRIGHVAIQHFDFAALNLARTGDQRQHARLADAIRADETHRAIGRDIQIDVGNRRRLAIAVGDAGQAGDGLRAHRGAGAGGTGRLTFSFSGQGVFASTRT